MTLLLAVLLPCVLWDGTTNPAALAKAHIDRVCVSADKPDVSLPSIKIEKVDTGKVIRISGPAISFRGDVASPSRLPWITLNGWRYLRNPGATFLVSATADNAPLTAAEAFAYGARALLKVDQSGLQPLGGMLDFLRTLDDRDLPPMANLGYIDDGSPESGEFMNLLVRRNLLFKVVPEPDPTLNVNVRIGEPGYPRSEAANPKLLAEKVRAQVTDSKRLLRIYGTDVVVGRLLGDGRSGRLYLINYAGSRYPVPGIHVRILGEFHSQHARQVGTEPATLQDVLVADGATEFTIPKLTTFAVIDLKQ